MAGLDFPNQLYSSEEQLYTYVDTLKTSIAAVSENLFRMHSEMKTYGTSLKEYKASNSKECKEVAKEYSKSSKKADKLLKTAPIQSELDESSLIILEREKADLKMYKFFLKSASKHINSKVTTGIYKNIQRALDSKPSLVLSDCGVQTVVQTVEQVERKKKTKKKVESQKTMPGSKRVCKLKVTVSDEEKKDEKLEGTEESKNF